MNRYFALVVTTLLLTTCARKAVTPLTQPYTETYFAWNPGDYTLTEDDKIKAEWTIDNDQLNGPSRAKAISYLRKSAYLDTVTGHASHQDYFTYGNYVNGKQDGHWVTYVGEDSIAIVENYRNGLRHGLQYKTMGRDTFYVYRYQHGLPHGEFQRATAWSPEQRLNGCMGKLYGRQLIRYKNGLLHGRQLSFWDNRIIEEILFEEGRLVAIKRWQGNVVDEPILDAQGNGTIVFDNYWPWTGLLSYLTKLDATGYPERSIFRSDCAIIRGELAVRNGVMQPGPIELEVCSNGAVYKVLIGGDRSVQKIKE